MQERTYKDIKASNDEILKKVNEFCKAKLTTENYLSITMGKIDKGEDCFIHVPDGATREELEEDLIKCKCGKEVSAVFQLCPYSSEIYGATNTCNCCDACRHECAMDI